MSRLCFSLLAFHVIACASAGGTKVTEPFIADLSDFKHAGVMVTSEDPDYDAQASALAAALKRKLRDGGMFRSVSDLDLENKGSVDLGILIMVRDATRVSEVVPLVFGPRSQMASLTFRVRLMRMSNHSYLGEAEMDGQYSGGEEFPSTTSEAVHMAADQVVNYLKSGMRFGRVGSPGG
ncbi:MAG: hypothetical protein GXP54_00960 [Deltaproteobacteria bacterium]|nr:hypothetical protein [Deltaproteobacteria bacterium]